MAKPARLAVPNHMMHDKTFCQQLPSPSSVNDRLHVVSALPNSVQSFPLIPIPVTLCITIRHIARFPLKSLAIFPT
jgi:hypothetical protein